MKKMSKADKFYLASTICIVIANALLIPFCISACKDIQDEKDREKNEMRSFMWREYGKAYVKNSNGKKVEQMTPVYTGQERLKVIKSVKITHASVEK